VRIGLDILSEVAGRSSGTETYLQGFLHALKRVNCDKHEFFLFVNSGNEFLYRVEDPCFRQVHFPCSNNRRPLRVLSQLLLTPYYARKLKLDVVNFLGTTGAFFVGCATVQHAKTLHHLQLPETIDPRVVAFRRLMMGPSARRADVVIANSESQRADIVRLLKVPHDRVVLVSEAVDHTVFFPKEAGDLYESTLEKYGVTEPYLLFVSSLWPYKNAHALIQAYALLRTRRQLPHKLVVVGGFPVGDYQSLLHRSVAHHGLEDDVRFVGHVSDRREVRDFYVGAALFAYPSLMETFGLTLLESMACGTPVVAANRGSIPEVAGGAAVLVDPDDHAEIADAIWRVMNDRPLRESLIAKGLRHAHEFTWERTARETLEAYRLAHHLRNG